MITPLRRLAVFLVGLILAATTVDATIMPPIGAGAFAVGSTNLEIAAPSAASPLVDYLKGKGSSQKTLYVADLLAHPEAALLTQVEVPANKTVYHRAAGTRMPLLLYVLYPTPADNPRADYVFPYPDTGDNVFPHMQRPGDKPLLAEPNSRLPLILYSHGFEGHGLWDLEHAKVFASHGYLVAVMFHGDGRTGFFSGLGLRPLQTRAALDYLLAHPDFATVIDRDRIGHWGSSFGGYSVLAALGGDTRDLPEPSTDARIKAGVGLVPFVGSRFGRWPFAVEAWPFGRDYRGLRSVRAPFLAIYAGNDENVRPEQVEAAVRQLSGPVTAVKLDGEQHLLSKNVWPDVHAWELRFFAAWLRGDEAARRWVYASTSVDGAAHDHKTYQRHAPGGAPDVGTNLR